MSLVTTEEVQALVHSDLSSEQLQAIIDREEADLTRRSGPPSRTEGGDDQELTETLVVPTNRHSVYVDRPIATVVTLRVSGDNFVNATTLTVTNDYTLNEAEGRVDRVSNGVPISWEKYVEITYVPEDDNNTRKSVIIDLVRIAVERQAFKRESTAGEYSYTSPDDWEAERESVMSRLKPWAIID